MKCLIKIGLYTYALFAALLVVTIPTLGQLLWKFGPEWCMVVTKDGDRCLGPGITLSIIFFMFGLLASACCAAVNAGYIDCNEKD